MVNPIKVLHIITQLDCGGSAENTLHTALRLSPEKYAVTLLCGVSDNPPSQQEKKAVERGIAIIRSQLLVRRIHPVFDLLALVALWFHLIRNRYEIIHTHTSKAGIIGRVAALLAGVRVSIHTPHGHVFYGYFGTVLTKIFIFLEQAVMLFTHTLITLTNQEKQDYLDHHIGPAKKIVTVFSGIPMEPFLHPSKNRMQMRQELGLSSTAFVAGCVARLVPIKNHSLIIDAVALLGDAIPGLCFVLIGDGQLRTELETKIAQRNLQPRFKFVGWRNDIADCMQAFDVFVLCSKNEGMGRVFVEAQAAGIPAIGSRVCGIPEVIDDGKTGYLINSGDAHDLSAKIKLLYARPDRTTIMKQDCVRFVNPTFSVENMIKAIETVYDRSQNEKPL